MKVFLSSTAQDLVAHRQVADDTILRLSQEAVVMERLLARIRLAWPDPPKAIQAAREALDLATAPDCQYAWGEADAAQVWGEAYFADHEATLAKRAFTRALEVRQRIEHPGVPETEKWLARAG